jgi:hypothetical protein
MPKKMTRPIRRKMLALHEEGACLAELKKEFGIIDTRTLLRNLKLAENERDRREVQGRIYTDAQRSHLAQVQELAERWQSSIGVKFPSGDFDIRVESEDLFPALRQHFPDPVLWAEYSTWKEHTEQYRKIWHELVQRGKEKVIQDAGSKESTEEREELPAGFITSALWYALDLRKKWKTEEERGHLPELGEQELVPAVKHLYRRRLRKASYPYALEFLPQKKDIAYGTAGAVITLTGLHYRLIKMYLGSPQVITLVELRDKLPGEAERIHRQLRLSLLKQIHISHTCEFCPVGELLQETV